MKRILVLAQDMRSARHEIEFQAFRITTVRAWRHAPQQLRSLGVTPSVSVIGACPVTALREMVGRYFDEIYIIGDWTRWDFGAPGAFSDFAGALMAQRYRGAEVKWERHW